MNREEQFRRNNDLFGIFMNRILEEPRFSEGIPQDSQVIFLPEHDLELKEANLELAKTLSAEGKQVVFVRITLVPETMTVFVPKLELVKSA